MNISVNVKELFEPLLSIELRYSPEKNDRIYFTINHKPCFEAVRDNSRSLLINCLEEIWSEFVQFVNNLVYPKKKMHALAEAQYSINAILIILKQDRFTLQYADSIETASYKDYDENDHTVLHEIGVVDYWTDLVKNELSYHLEFWLNKINAFLEKLRLGISGNELFDTTTPWILAEGKASVYRRLDSLYKYLHKNKIVDADIESFRSFFVGGDMKSFKWMVATSFLPDFFRSVLSVTSIFSISSNTKYWDYVLDRITDQDGNRIKASVRNGGKYGTDEQRKVIVFKPAEILRQK